VVCLRLNCVDLCAVTVGLMHWVRTFNTPALRQRLRAALWMWREECFVAPNFARLRSWIGVDAVPEYAAARGQAACGVWLPREGRCCDAPTPPGGPGTMCAAHRTALVVDDTRRSGDRESYLATPMGERVDIEASRLEGRRRDRWRLHSETFGTAEHNKALRWAQLTVPETPVLPIKREIVADLFLEPKAGYNPFGRPGKLPRR
jgi:hypothetical protein